MKLKTYIAKIGDEKAAELFQVTKRACQSWRLGQRYPSVEHAKFIVDNSRVTFKGIYEIE